MSTQPVLSERSPVATAQGPVAPEIPSSDFPALFQEPLDIRSIALSGIFLLLFLFAVSYSRDLLLPILLAFFLNFLFAPLVRRFSRWHVPEALGAALVFVAVLGTLSFGIYKLSGPAADWIAKAPQSVPQIRTKLRSLLRPMEEAAQASAQVEELAQVGEDNTAQQVEIQQPGLGQMVFTETQEFLAGAAIMFVLLYFLLAAGDLFLRKLVTILPRLEDKKRAVEIVRQIEDDLSAYLLTITLVNTGLGVVIGGAMFLLGMPNPVLWGVMAGVLNFIPYVGSLLGMAAVSVVALLTFAAPGSIFLVPLVYFLLTTGEAYFVTPIILSRRLTLNPVAIFLWLVLWGWLWGIPGVLISVPLLAMLKIMCDRIEPLMPFGEFLGQ
jgi:predicted PurR-regulated permease PerM